MNSKRYLNLTILGAASCLAIALLWLTNGPNDSRKSAANPLGLLSEPLHEYISPNATNAQPSDVGRNQRDRYVSQRNNRRTTPLFALRRDDGEVASLVDSASPSLFVKPGDAVLTPGNETEESASRPDRPDEAIKFRMMQLRDENGEIPVDGLLKAQAQLRAMRKAQEKRMAAAHKTADMKVAGLTPSDWTWLGPGNVGGRIRSIVIDPNNTNNMWVGSVSGGIWHSTDAGNSWTVVDDFMANLAISSLAIDPTNPSTMYAGTGELFAAALNPSVLEGQNFAPDGLRGLGVFKSTDGGVTWNQLSSTNPADPAVCGGGGVGCSWSYVDRLAISPNSATILAANSLGVLRSTDGGGTWVQTGFFTALDADFDPTNSLNAISSGFGVAYYSTDGGSHFTAASFSPIINPVINPGPPPITATPRVELAYAPSNPSIVYASVDSKNGEVYRSINGGQSYTQVNTGNNFFLGAGDQGSYDNALWVDPVNPNNVIVGGIDLWLSTDGGSNFTQISKWQCGPGQTGPCADQSAHADQHIVVSDPNYDGVNNKRVYFGNDGGMFRTDDVLSVALQSGWVDLNHDLGATQFYGGAATNDKIVAGAQDNSTLMVTGDVTNWSVVFGGDGGFCAIDPSDTNYLYGEYPSLEIFRSNDGGATASRIDCSPAPPSATACTSGGITEEASANFVAPMMLDPGNANTMLAGALSLWRATNIKAATPTWGIIKPTVVPRPHPGAAPSPTPAISAIAVSSNNSDFVVVGHNDGQMYLTLDGTGNNPPNLQQCAPGFSPCWTRIDNATTPQRFVTKLVIDDTKNPSWIYATFGGFSSDNVYRSIDLGNTWTKVTGTGATALPSVPVRGFAINPVNPKFLYAGTEIGLFASEDAGATWQQPQGGPANVSVDDLLFQKGDLVALTHGRGAFATRTGVFDLPICTNDGSCPCFGRTDCPCSWPKNQFPGPNDDVYIACPMTGPGYSVRTLRVDSRLDLENGLWNVSGDIVNNGLIESTPGTTGSLTADNLFNIRPPRVVTERGVIELNGSIFATGDIENGGIMTASSEISANNLSNAASDGFQGPDASLAATLIAVKGNIFNNGTLNAGGANGNLAISNNGIPTTHTLSGTGAWQVTGLFGVSETTQIANDLTINAGTFNIGGGGTFKLQNHNLTFNGQSFDNGRSVGEASTLDLGSGNLYFNGTDHLYASNLDAVGNEIGSVIGTGTIFLQPVGGSAGFRSNRTGRMFQPSLEIVSGTINSEDMYVGGSFKLDQGATLNLQGFTFLTPGNATVNGTVNGDGTFLFDGQTLTNNGSFEAFALRLNQSGSPLSQEIGGSGAWTGGTFLQIGSPGSPSTTKLLNNLTLPFSNLAINGGSVLDLQNFTLNYTGSDATSLNVTGTGTFEMSPASGTANVSGTSGAGLLIASGTVTARPLTVNGPIDVDAGATLAISSTFSGNILATGNVTINGTLSGHGRSFGLGGNNSFTNNGVVDSTFLSFGSDGGPVKTQQLGGAGTWTGATGWLFVGSESTTMLTSDLTYTGPQLFIDGKINAGAFTFTLPCPATWQGAGDIVGNIRRTNLGACTTPIAFGNPLTTIKFNSGTPPTEITVHVDLNPPPGFPNAVARSYVITPVGGSNYVATLRLHYLDSELNGNNENGLFLFRNDGTAWNAIGVTAQDTVNNWVEYAGVTQFSPWTIASDLPLVTAAPVLVGGRVVSASGRPISNARVTLTSQGGITRTSLTNPFGCYQIFGVPSGESYLLSISSKGYRFSQSTRLINVNDAISDADFVADN